MLPRKTIALLLTTLILFAGRANSAVKLPALISDNMVLQQGVNVCIWGNAAANEKVAVSFAGQTQTTTADADGKWSVKLTALKASNEGAAMTVAGSATPTPIVIKNVLVGEVWICSGQSNMVFKCAASHAWAVDGPKATCPTMRFFQVWAVATPEPVDDVLGKWIECTPASAGNFSAVAYYFAKQLIDAHGCPAGMIQASLGATICQAWTSLQGLESDPGLAKVAQRAHEVTAEVAAAKHKLETQDLPKWEADHKVWEAQVAVAKNSKPPTTLPKEPGKPGIRPLPDTSPGSLFNGTIAPLIPYTIAGVIWYQGEFNVNDPALYSILFPTMITDWRHHWGQGDFPFIFVQLPNFAAAGTPDPNSGWVKLRQAQTDALKLPKTGMAVTIDIGDEYDIHPKDKRDVGRRLFLAAEKMAYGKDIVCSGPTFDTLSAEANKLRIKFTNVGGGLKIARHPSTRPIGPDGIEASVPEPTQLTGFMVCGADHKFVAAQARIDGAGVIVWADAVSSPAIVRYAWFDRPVCNLYNAEDLPAVPFQATLNPKP